MMLNVFKDRFGRKRFPTADDVNSAWDRGYANGSEDLAKTLGILIFKYESGTLPHDEFILNIKKLCPEDYDQNGNSYWV